MSLQLSSPIEEGILSTVYDPQQQTDQAPEGSKVVFRGVETTVATLTVSAKDADIPLGTSSPHDVAPICSLDPMNMKDTYVTELPVAIVGEASAVEAIKDAEANKKDGAVVKVEAVAEVAAVVQPICTVTLRLTFTPSPKDQREELYELLNKASRRKATALENLRKISMQAAKDQRSSASPDSGGSMTVGGSGGGAVKAGFLNSKGKKEGSQWQKLYAKTIGPDSIFRRGAMIMFSVKDYLIFFGAIGFMHFQGQMLALPPPV